jgi:G3E family GTPase
MKFKRRTPVTLVGGFLGAGKTTLVNRLVSSGERRYGVVVNEFGETGVDSALIEELDGEGVAEISGGCLCCVGREDLSVALYGLVCHREPPDYILIELSGVADPVPAAQQLLTTELRALVDLDSIVAVADARNLKQTMLEAPEGKAQLAYANVVVLNKADQVGEEELEEAGRIVRNLNPLARVVIASYAAVEPETVTELEALAPDWRPLGHAVEHSADLTTFTLRSREPLPLERWMSFHRRMILARPGKVLRAKGIIRFRELDDPMVLQAVRELYTFDAYEGEHAGGAELVVIGRDLDEREYRKEFARLIAGAGTRL